MVWSPHKQGKKFSIILTLLLFTAAKLCLTFLLPHGLYPIGLLCPWDFPGKNTGVGCNFLLRDPPDPGIKPGSPALQADFFTI